MTPCRLALSVVVLAVSAGMLATPARARADDSAKAKKLFKKGVKLFKRKQYDAAVEAYRQAAQAEPEVGAIHVNLARAYEKTGDCGRALLHFQAYLGLKPDAPDREGINEERKLCVARLGAVARLTVELIEPEEPEQAEEEEQGEEEPPGIGIRLDGAPMGRAPLQGLILAPGEYALEAFPDTGEVKTHKVKLVADEGTEVVLGRDGERAPGYLRLTVRPPSAEVRIDGEKLKREALDDRVRVAAGQHELEVADPTGRLSPWSGTVSVGAGEEEMVEVSLKGGPGRILFKIPEGAVAMLDGEPVDAALPIDVRPGSHQVRVLAPGRQPWLREVEVPAGETLELMANLAVAEAPSLSLSQARLSALGSAGVGAAAGLTGIVFGALASSQYGEIEDRIKGGGDYASADEIDAIDSRQTLANVMFGVAVVGIGAGVALWLVEPDLSWLFGGVAGSDAPPPAGRPGIAGLP